MFPEFLSPNIEILFIISSVFFKYDIYNNYIAPRYNVKYVFDDRNQVVDMWRNGLGLTCFQVADGNF